MSSGPKRFMELREAPSREVGFIRVMIAAESADFPPDEKMEGLAARLGPVVERAIVRRSPARLLVPAILVSLAVGIGWLAWSSQDTHRAGNLGSSGASVVAGGSRKMTGSPDRGSPPVPLPFGDSSTGASQLPLPASVPVEALPTASALARPAAPAAARACTNDVELVDDADAALRSGDAARALALTREHSERCPAGTFVQERERIAIEALGVLGRVDAMRARAHAFEERFPSSPHLRRVHKVVGEHSR